MLNDCDWLEKNVGEEVIKFWEKNLNDRSFIFWDGGNIKFDVSKSTMCKLDEFFFKHGLRC